MRLVLALVLVMTTSACLDEPKFESAYATETDLCTPEAAPEFAARVDACRERYVADGSCAGILSFRGTLELEDGVASSRELDRTAFVVTTTGSGLELANVELAGHAPFFEYALELEDIGGLVASGDIMRTVSLGRTMLGVAPNLTDNRLTFSLLIEDGAASKGKEFRTGSVVITRQTPTEFAGTLDASNFAGDALTGCFHAFVTETSTQ